MVVTTSRVDVAELRRTHSIADVVARYGVELQPRGRILVGRCPFHDDRGRPNLYVYPETNSFYCFRCAIGGDVIDFIRRTENVGFPEACRRLAGLPLALPGPVPEPPRRRGRRWDRLTIEEQVVLNTACALYQRALWRTPEALAYVRARGIPDWVIRQCALGYADGHGLEVYLRRHSGLPIAQDLGLLRNPSRANDTGTLHEHLAGRIVVPELRGGQCVWLIGRTLVDDPRRPKYLALPGERPVLGYERVAGQREAFLVEGVFDLLTALSWHLPAFSPCGTHLPAERLGLLARTAVVYGVLDADAAGDMAAERFGDLLGERWRPLRLPEGCDLNALATRPDGRRTFFHLLATARRRSPQSVNHGGKQ